MTDAVYSRAQEAFEATSSVGGLERAVGILVRGGVDLPAIRSWAISTAQAYGIAEYLTVHDWRRMLGGAAKLRAEG
jgi:hypothetical protein